MTEFKYVVMTVEEWENIDNALGAASDDVLDMCEVDDEIASTLQAILNDPHKVAKILAEHG